MPAFDGPYAAEIADAWRESDSDFVRGVIADEQITDAEWAELGVRMSDCLADEGLDFLGFDDNGTYRVGPSRVSGDDATRVLDGCERESGETWIHALRLSMSTNPDNAPIEELMTDCLIRNGAVAAGYTAEDFARDSPQQTIPFVDSAGTATFWACNEDPSYARDEG